MLQPEKYEAHDRNQEIAVKNDAGVPRGEIVRRDHLIDVTAGRAPEEAGGPDDGREPQIEASPERQQSHHGKAEAREADLQLEGTVLPSDETRRQFPEKDVQDEIVEIGKSDREQHEIREQRFDDERKGARRARPPKRDGGSEQTQHEKRQREVAEDERDDVFH